METASFIINCLGLIVTIFLYLLVRQADKKIRLQQELRNLILNIKHYEGVTLEYWNSDISIETEKLGNQINILRTYLGEEIRDLEKNYKVLGYGSRRIDLTASLTKIHQAATSGDFQSATRQIRTEARTRSIIKAAADFRRETRRAIH